MSKINTYIKLNSDILLEWIYDDDNNHDYDYTVINNTYTKTVSYTNSNKVDNVNNLTQQLFTLDGVLNTLGVVSDTERTFIGYSNYVNVPVINYNKIKIHFPINYTFPSNLGFYINIYTKDYDNLVDYELCNLFIDITKSEHFSQIQLSTKYINFNEKLYGKYIEFDIPSVDIQSKLRTGNTATAGTVNYNLTSSKGLSLTSPIFIDFRFLLDKTTLLGNDIYTSSTKNILSITQTPIYKTLGVNITSATDGDYFIINGTFNNSNIEFVRFMENLESSGNRSYIIYTVTVYEENIPTDTFDYYISEEFSKGIKLRPVLLYSSTTSSINVSMKIINTVDNTVLLRTAEYGMLSNETVKYGKQLTTINIKNAYKPKLYNGKSQNNIIVNNTVNNSEIKYKQIPLLISNQNIVISDVSINYNSNVYYGENKLQLVIHPTDNIFKFKIAENISSDTYKPLIINNSESKLILSFIGEDKTLDINIFELTKENDSNNGIYIFSINTNDVKFISNIKNKKFYLILNSINYKTTLYSGTFIMSNSEEYINLSSTSNNTTSVINTNTNSNVINSNVSQNTTIINDGANGTSNDVILDSTLKDVNKLGLTSSQMKLIL